MKILHKNLNESIKNLFPVYFCDKKDVHKYFNWKIKFNFLKMQ